MNDKQFKKATIAMVETMIQYADKGPSGFWVEDRGGCGNPLIFPEFAEGIEKGRLVQKSHYLCPWNTAILFAGNQGNIETGCYYSCSIRKAEFLSEEMLREVLRHFKKRLESGGYDDLEHITALLTPNECAYIEEQEAVKEAAEERRFRDEQQRKRKLAQSLLRKYKNDEDFAELIEGQYGNSVVVQTEYGGLNFSPDAMKKVVGGEKLTYNEYLDLQIRSLKKRRKGLELCRYGSGSHCAFQGEIIKIKEKTVCFGKISLDGTYSDGLCFSQTEEHIWMDRAGFEEYQVGDRLEFYAEVYEYVKTGHGKSLDYSLRNPEDITKIEKCEETK